MSEANLIYRKVGTPYMSAITCHLEMNGQAEAMYVTRDGTATRREHRTEALFERLGSICNDEGVELGPLGEAIKADWLELHQGEHGVTDSGDNRVGDIRGVGVETAQGMSITLSVDEVAALILALEHSHMWAYGTSAEHLAVRRKLLERLRG